MDVVERWVPQARIRKDLFGCLDLVALDGKCICGIQATSGSNVSARVKKIQAEPRAREWLEHGGRIVVMGWSRRKKTGKWEVREVEITASQFSLGEGHELLD